MKDHNVLTKKSPYTKYITPSVERLEAGIERGLADSAAGKVMSSDECLDQLKAKLTSTFNHQSKPAANSLS